MRLNLNSAMNVIGLKRKKLFDLLRIRKDLHCWLEGKEYLDTAFDQLSNETNEIIVFVSCLIDEARGCFEGAENARRWFGRRNSALNHKKPQKILFVRGVGNKEGIERVRNLIGQIERGIYS